MPFTRVQQFVDAEIYGGSDPEVGCPDDPRDRLAVLKEIQNDVAALIQATKEMAVEDGIAEYKTFERTNVPNLSWWKATKPKSWARYCTISTYDRFTWIK